MTRPDNTLRAFYIAVGLKIWEHGYTQHHGSKPDPKTLKRVAEARADQLCLSGLRWRENNQAKLAALSGALQGKFQETGMAQLTDFAIEPEMRNFLASPGGRVLRAHIKAANRGRQQQYHTLVRLLRLLTTA